MTIRLHRGDLPDLTRYTGSVAIDTETMGLHPHRDRLCVVQMSNGDGSADVVQIPKDHGKGQADAPNLKALLADPKITKIFHFARFDLAALYNALGVMPQPVYCTKIASRLCRTYTDRHGLKDLVREVLNVDLSKQQQSSDWGAQTLSEAQLAYAASDVLHLHDLRERLDTMLAREGRTGLAQACFGTRSRSGHRQATVTAPLRPRCRERRLTIRTRKSAGTGVNSGGMPRFAGAPGDAHRCHAKAHWRRERQRSQSGF